MTMAFWISLAIVIYTYLGYPLVLWLLVIGKRTLTRNVKNRKNSNLELPRISLVIPAYNEEDWIVAKIENCNSLEYPVDKYQIVVITDGSDDNTAQLVKSMIAKNLIPLKHFHQDKREGKVGAINRLIPFLDREITLFTDANAMLNSQALLYLVAHFVEEKVGAVAGEKYISQINQDGITSVGEGMYWLYESQLKKWDAELASVVGAAGELLAIRTSLLQRVPDNAIIEDFHMSMSVIQKGYRIQYESEAVASETASIDIGEEFKRKTRIAAGGMQATFRFLTLLNPFRFGTVSFLLASHRILRWTLAPISLIFVLLSNIFLTWSDNGVYTYLLIGQILIYLAATIGWLQAKHHRLSKIFYIPFYFLFMNLAVMVGNTQYLFGKQSVLWKKSKRILPKYIDKQ